jgi:hypothetical protein
MHNKKHAGNAATWKRFRRMKIRYFLLYEHIAHKSASSYSRALFQRKINEGKASGREQVAGGCFIITIKAQNF